MLAAAEEALRGREFESLAEADRVVAEAHLRAIAVAVGKSAYPGAHVGDVVAYLTGQANRARHDRL
jgi:hypothetical protein